MEIETKGRPGVGLRSAFHLASYMSEDRDPCFRMIYDEPPTGPRWARDGQDDLCVEVYGEKGKAHH